jgi:hypothetical protein
MKIDPRTIKPVVFTVEDAGKWRYLLACADRIFKSGSSTEKGYGSVLAPKGTEWQRLEGWDHVLFPAMVDIPMDGTKISRKTGVTILYGVGGGDRNWTLLPPAVLGMGEVSAQATVAEAWRGVKGSGLNMETMLPEHKFSTGPVVAYKGGVALWMINAWVRWDLWNRLGLNIPQRVEELRGLGFSLTPKDLENAKTVRGMPKALKE